jgi:two-component system osmolarity sensor histidine kinase EnvZ
VSPPWPRTLFGRTALLIGCALAFFSMIAWAVMVWTTIIPAAETTGHLLAQRTLQAAKLYRAGMPLPEGVQVSADASAPPAKQRVDSSSLYLKRLRGQIQQEIPEATVLIVKAVMPTELWVRVTEVPERWFILRWRVARPETPMALGAVVLAGGLLSLIGAALFARRLTAPLAGLAAATRRVGEGEVVTIDVSSGPSEVRELAMAFQAMSQRLAVVDEQRELMLAGLSHDLRSPLARMRVAVDLIEAPPGTDLHEQIIADVEEVDRIVGQFLHYVRAGYRELPARAVADEILRESLGRHVKQGEVLLELNAPQARLLPVESLRRVVANLVQNALEYGQAPVTVRTSLGPAQLCVSVMDRGEGISAAEWEQAVRPFNRLRAAPGGGHSGLGLATVERLAHAAQGKLTSRRSEHGFVVEVTFATTAFEAQ